MNLRTLWQTIRRYRWRSAIATVLASVRLHGWSATLSKVLFRLRVYLQGRYRKSSWGKGRETQERAGQATEVFARPVVVVVGALDLPQCKKYRVSQKVEFFSSLGWDCYYAHYNDALRVIDYLQISTAVIFYRVPACAQYDDYLEEADRLGVRTFYDIDDPIFSAAVYGENKNLDHLAPQEREHLLGSATQFSAAMKRVDALILSTTYLRDLAHTELGVEAYLWRNLADAATLSIAGKVSRQRDDETQHKIIVGYASGSRAHDEDFNVATNALVKILETYNDVELQIIGYAEIPPELQPYQKRINTRPFSGYLEYFEALSQLDVNIVPLVDDRFNACKSAIRYLEASLCGVPTVASAVGQFSEIIVDGQDGYLAETQQGWISALASLIESSDLRQKIGEAAKNTVMSYHTFSGTDVIDGKLLEQFALSNE